MLCKDSQDAGMETLPDDTRHSQYSGRCRERGDEELQFHHITQLRPKNSPPHCITCCCTTSDKVKDSYRSRLSTGERCLQEQNAALLNYGVGNYERQQQQQQHRDSPVKPSSRRQSGRRKTRPTTVDELLREMKLKTRYLSDDELLADLSRPTKNEEEVPPAVTSSSSSHRRERRRSGNYYSVSRCHSKLTETSARRSAAGEPPEVPRSCERWPILDRKRDDEDEALRQQMLEPTVENVGTDNTEEKVVRDELSKSRCAGDSYVALRDDWRQSGGADGPQTAMLDAGDFGLSLPLSSADKDARLDSDEEACFTGGPKDALSSSDPHVRELKQVRREFIARITEEVQRLHRLQLHLDGCSPRGARRTRSVSTMTTARRPDSAA